MDQNERLTDREIYLLGQIYGKLHITENLGKKLNYDECRMYSFSTAAPLAGVIDYYGELLVGSKITEEVRQYIILRMWEINPNHGMDGLLYSVIPIEKRGIFQLADDKASIERSVKFWVEKTGLSNEEIADKLGISMEMLYDWIDEKVPLTQKELYRLECLGWDK